MYKLRLLLELEISTWDYYNDDFGEDTVSHIAYLYFADLEQAEKAKSRLERMSVSELSKLEEIKEILEINELDSPELRQIIEISEPTKIAPSLLGGNYYKGTKSNATVVLEYDIPNEKVAQLELTESKLNYSKEALIELLDNAGVKYTFSDGDEFIKFENGERLTIEQAIEKSKFAKYFEKLEGESNE